MQLAVSEGCILVENLRTAFEFESQTRAQYRMFAVEADDEGWRGGAGLFRSAATRNRSMPRITGGFCLSLAERRSCLPNRLTCVGRWRT